MYPSLRGNHISTVMNDDGEILDPEMLIDPEPEEEDEEDKW